MAGYGDDFYTPENIVGYTGTLGDPENRPTVYFRKTENGFTTFGHITQDYHKKDNVGRELIRKRKEYKQGNEWAYEETKDNWITLDNIKDTLVSQKEKDGELITIDKSGKERVFKNIHVEIFNGMIQHPSRNQFFPANEGNIDELMASLKDEKLEHLKTRTTEKDIEMETKFRTWDLQSESLDTDVDNILGASKNELNIEPSTNPVMVEETIESRKTKKPDHFKKNNTSQKKILNKKTGLPKIEVASKKFAEKQNNNPKKQPTTGLPKIEVASKKFKEKQNNNPKNQPTTGLPKIEVASKKFKEKQRDNKENNTLDTSKLRNLAKKPPQPKIDRRPSNVDNERNANKKKGAKNGMGW
ncbi:hypothetical protein [Aquimarina pacifica]|uniref:hypothetical protein n=1 Tax=Aquimarina pacifica TaxID=1296415 RepID=UPI000470048F|nr:hypothetical protein [Aquimarina pacifica]